MNRLSAFLLALAALTLAQFDPVMADGFYRQYRHHGVRGAYAEPDLTYDSACSVGWWQTLRHGHVRPVWGVPACGTGTAVASIEPLPLLGSVAIASRHRRRSVPAAWL